MYLFDTFGFMQDHIFTNKLQYCNILFIKLTITKASTKVGTRHAFSNTKNIKVKYGISVLVEFLFTYRQFALIIFLVVRLG